MAMMPNDPVGEDEDSDVVCSDPPPGIDFAWPEPPQCVACFRRVYHDSIEGWHHWTEAEDEFQQGVMGRDRGHPRRDEAVGA